MKHPYASASLILALGLAASAQAQPGTLDPTFGTAGIQLLAPGTVHDVAQGVVALADNSQIICGSSLPDGSSAGFVAHLLQDGSLDPAFGTNSGYTFVDAGEETYFYDIAVDGEGRIVVCGIAYPTFAQSVVIVARMLPDGSMDPAFGTDGVVLTAIDTQEAGAQALVMQPDGKIVVAGSTGFGDLTDGLLIRYKSDGSTDGAFDGDGIFINGTYPGKEDAFNGVDLFPDGSVIAGGSAVFAQLFRAFVIKVDGAAVPDATFGVAGVLEPVLDGTDAQLMNIKAASEKFFVCGQLTRTVDNRDIFVAKYGSTGLPAGDFGTAGITYVDSDENEAALDLAVQNDGKLYVCGTTGSFGLFVPRDFLLVRLTGAGQPDAGFGTAGQVITSIRPDFDDANAIAIQPDGKVVCAGFAAGTDNDIAVVRYITDIASGITANETDASFSLYPNPANGTTVNLVAANTVNSASTVSLFDAQGRQVMGSFLTVLGQQPTTLVLPEVANGVYHVRVQQDNGTTELPLLIVR